MGPWLGITEFDTGIAASASASALPLAATALAKELLLRLKVGRLGLGPILGEPLGDIGTFLRTLF